MPMGGRRTNLGDAAKAKAQALIEKITEAKMALAIPNYSDFPKENTLGKSPSARIRDAKAKGALARRPLARPADTARLTKCDGSAVAYVSSHAAPAPQRSCASETFAVPRGSLCPIVARAETRTRTQPRPHSNALFFARETIS
jgi:hypothetical protein